MPKRPSFSLLIPAVKNKVFAGPAVASLPNVSDHRPSIVMRKLFVPQVSDELVSEAVERGDPAAAEIPHQDRVAKLPSEG